MDKLPLEILHHIFIQLPLRRKLECMLVCSKWASILLSTGLLHTICRIEKDSEKFLDMLKDNPCRSTQVEKLMLIDSLNDDNFDQRRILELFPNLRFVYIKRLHRTRTINNSRQPLEPIALPRNLIEHIIDLDTSEFTCYTLTSGLCPRLTVLEMDFIFTSRSCRHLIPLLKNAPHLLKLKINNVSLSLEDLESIHADLPLLYSFTLFDAHITVHQLPANIIPATGIKTLLLYLKYMQIESQVQLLTYIKSKYPKTEHFRFWNPTQDVWLQDDRAFFCRNGLMPFLQHTASQLKTLEISSLSFEPHFFKNLDSYGCRIQNLYAFSFGRRDILQQLVQSDQSKYVERLTLHNVQPFSFNVLQSMICLTSLEIIYCYQGDDQYRNIYSVVHFNHLLEMCPPTLETLTVRHVNLDCDYITGQVFPIKNLTIEGPRLPRNIDVLLSNCLPQLSSLTLLDCVRIGSSIRLPNLHLSYLELLPERLDHITTLSVTTLKDRKCSHYSVKKKYFYLDNIELDDGHCHPFIHDAIIATPLEELEDETPMVTIECGSVRTLIINGRLVC